MKKLLFSKLYPSPAFSAFLLGMRLIFGILLFCHGLEKLSNYPELMYVFPDPLGIGSEISYILVVFAEIVCSLTFITGILFRLTLIPMIIAMSVAFFEIHESSIAQGELAFIYLAVFAMLAITGPGIYAIDRWITKYCPCCIEADNCPNEE